MVNVLILSPIDSEAIDELRQGNRVTCAFGGDADWSDALTESDVIVCRSGVHLDADLLDRAPLLRLIIRAGSGTDNIDLDRVRARGIPLITIPEPGAKAVAEMAVALMLALGRNLLRADQLLRNGVWAKHELTGLALARRTLGVVGAGTIGTRVGELGVALGMSVLGCVDRPTPQERERLRASGISLVQLPELLSRSDFVSVHVPLRQSTRNLIGASELSMMKRDAFLINLARGGVVDELALRDALVGGGLAGAALDVHVAEGDGKISPLADLGNVILTPHIGAGTRDAQREIGQRVVELVAELQSPDKSSLADLSVA